MARSCQSADAADGAAPIPNGGAGIHVATGASIGGPGAAGNRIAENTGDGVFVAPEATGATTVLENEIFANGQLAIDLGVADEPAPGVTANDPGDVDTGGNGLQNFPALTAATRGFSNSVQVRGAFDSGSGSYTLRVYANDACDPSANGEAAQFVGSGTVSPGPSFSVAVPVTGVTPAVGQVLTATATDAGGHTSELSPCVTVRNGVRLASASYSVNETAGTASIDVERAVGIGTETVRVDTVAGGSATSGADYTAVQQVVQFDPGQTTKAAAIPILDDAALEDLETVNLALTNPSAGLELGTPPLRNTAVLTITSNELPSVQLATESQQVAEGAGSATVTITRNAAYGTSSVRVRTQNGTATGPGDFAATDQVVQFSAGQTSRDVSIFIMQDASDEPEEAFTVALSEPSGAVLGTTVTTAVRIADDDLAPATAPGGGLTPADPVSPPAAKARQPDSQLDRLARAFTVGRLKILSGSASDPDGDLAHVDVALVSAVGGARAAASGPTCLHYGRAGRITRKRAGLSRRCSPRQWLRASGSTRWRFRLPRRLPRGVWTIYVRASDADGLRETSFTAGDGNRAAVRIKPR